MGSLDGIVVLALENYIAGPFASMMLADRGAEVIKIESPRGGDGSRSVPPVRRLPDGTTSSLSFFRANRNKRSVALDLKTDPGRDILQELASKADVLLDNLRPGALRDLGVPYESLRHQNRRLVYTTISGYGHDDVLPSPYRSRPAFDITAQAMAGLLRRPAGSEHEPVYVGFPMADIYAGTLAAMGTLEALLQRVSTGVGQRVDVSLYDAALVMNELATVVHGATGMHPRPGVHALASPFGSYRAADGHVAIAVLGDRIWKRLGEAMGMPALAEDPRFGTPEARQENADALREQIEEWLGQFTREEATSHLTDAGIPAAPVNDVEDVIDCPHVAARDMLTTLNDPLWGAVPVVANPVKLSGPGSSTPAVSPPALGQDTANVLQQYLGMDHGTLSNLAAAGVVGMAPDTKGD